MEIELTANEVRVLGCLIEKELTTPEYYPLTINSLTAACNQKSNRDPVLSLTEHEVHTALELLKGKNLAWQRNQSGARVPKFEHNIGPKFELIQQEIAVLCALMLRGPLTPGEIRGSSGRMYAFKDPFEVESTLKNLIDNAKGPFVIKLPMQPGRKEHRYAHLFSGAIVLEPETIQNQPHTISGLQMSTQPDRLSQLQEKVDQLAEELTELKQAFVDFKKSFE